jgi:hypothetical protein
MKAKLDILKDHADGKRHKMRVPHANENPVMGIVVVKFL